MRTADDGIASPVTVGPAIDALLRGAAFVGARYTADSRSDGTVSAMMVFNILREFDVLLGLAISEASRRWGVPSPLAEAPNAARLRVLQSQYDLDMREQIALRELDTWRGRMMRRARDASAPPRPWVPCADRLVPAAALYHQIGRKLAHRASSDTAARCEPTKFSGAGDG